MKKIIAKEFPDHWPYVHSRQQFEGFKSTIERMTITVWEFERRMRVLVQARFMSKSRMYKLIKWFRHIKDISYKDYNNKRNKIRATSHISKSLWL